MNPELYADLRKRLAKLEKGLEETRAQLATVVTAAGGEVIVEKGARGGKVERWERPDGSVRYAVVFSVAVEESGECRHERTEPDILTACDVCLDCGERIARGGSSR